MIRIGSEKTTCFDKGKPGESQRRKATGASAAKARHASQLPYDRDNYTTLSVGTEGSFLLYPNRGDKSRELSSEEEARVFLQVKACFNHHFLKLGGKSVCMYQKSKNSLQLHYAQPCF